MKKLFFTIMLAGFIAAATSACKAKGPETTETAPPQVNVPVPAVPLDQGREPAMPPAHPPAPGMDIQQGTEMPAAAPSKTGKVVETMNSGGYTYVQVDTGREKFWAAAPQFDVKVGEKVTVPAGMPMSGFKSSSLNRTFDLVYFVPAIGKGNQTPSAAPGMPGRGQSLLPQHPRVDASKAAKDANISFDGIKRPAGGITIGELFAEQANLSGKDVTLRGKVVKFNPQIMGKNWIHIQDGTGKQGASDLTVTTEAMVKVGDTILVKGTVVTNRDFGLGYKYDVIIENAQVTVE